MLIDNKGKLFGIINIFDFLFIGIFIAIVIILIKLWIGVDTPVLLKMKAEKQPAWVLKSLKQGDKEYDILGKEIARVEKIENLKSSERGDVFNNTIILTVQIVGKKSNNGKEIRFKNKLVKVGSQIELYLSNTQINGTITELNPQKNKNKEKIVALMLYDQYPWLGEALKSVMENQKKNTIYDEQITDLDVEPALKSFSDNFGQLQKTRDPVKVDISLKIKLIVKEENNEYIYNETQLLLIGNKLAVEIGKTNILGEITKIEDAN